MAETIDQLKQLIRTEVRSKRAALSQETKAELAAGLLEQLTLLVSARDARSVSCYFPVRGEPNTTPFLEWALKHDIEVLLPSSREDGLLDWVVYRGEDMAPGLFGIPEPTGEALSPIAVNDVDLMLIPACAVDESGNRLGWGRGFFDKSITSMEAGPPTFAVVYDSEIIETVPTEKHDARIYGAVTPTRVLYFDDFS